MYCYNSYLQSKTKEVFTHSMKRYTLIMPIFCLASLVATAQVTPQLKYFPLNDVKIEEGLFKQHQQTDICYLLGLDADRLLAPYLKEAGLDAHARNYSNWENTGLDGHIGGHYLSALSLMYASTGDPRIGERLDYVLAQLHRCQDNAGDGYLCGVPGGRQIWTEIKNGNVRAAAFGLNDRWVPLYNIHKIFNGLRDAYIVAGKADARDMLIKLTDWFYNITDGLSDQQMEDMLRSEHGGLNEVFADVYAIEKDARYLKMAKRFSHKKILNPLAAQHDELTGIHANTQIPKVIGFERIAQLADAANYHDAATFFWDDVVGKRTISIGGNSVCEHFHPADDYTSMLESEQGPETCNTYNMLRLTKLLYAADPQAKYTDYYERALFNHILSSQSLTQGGFVYFTPMLPGHYRVYSQPQTSFWCCVGSGIENHARYGEAIYAHDNNTLYVNLFISSSIEWKEKGLNLTLHSSLDNSHPALDKAILTFNIDKGSVNKNCQVMVRIPDWVRKGSVALLNANGHEQIVALNGNYLSLPAGVTHATVTYEMESVIAEQLPDGKPYYSFRRGPFVFATEISKDNQTGIYADDSRGGHIAAGPRYDQSLIPVIIADNINEAEKRFELGFNNGEYNVLMNINGEDKNVRLIPFPLIDGSRYNVYFRICSSSEYDSMMKAKAEHDAAVRADAERTIDKVVCGEQQPESDHFIKYNACNTGNTHGIHWRETSDQFSYSMNLNGAKRIVVLYENDANRSFEVSVAGKANGLNINTSETLVGTQNGEFILQLKHEINSDARVFIKAVDGKLTNHIKEIKVQK